MQKLVKLTLGLEEESIIVDLICMPKFVESFEFICPNTTKSYQSCFTKVQLIQSIVQDSE